VGGIIGRRREVSMDGRGSSCGLWLTRDVLGVKSGDGYNVLYCMRLGWNG
jgi:hypothetical protein